MLLVMMLLPGRRRRRRSRPDSSGPPPTRAAPPEADADFAGLEPPRGVPSNRLHRDRGLDDPRPGNRVGAGPADTSPGDLARLVDRSGPESLPLIGTGGAGLESRRRGLDTDENGDFLYRTTLIAAIGRTPFRPGPPRIREDDRWQGQGDAEASA